MNLLFFFVHPSKFHVFRNTINILKNNGHHIDILITSKDVLEELVANEGWDYTNIFPEGRKISWLPTKVGASINLIRTINRLNKYINKSEVHYDLFVTDDLLVVNGWLKKVPTFHMQDDDITIVPESAFILHFADYVLSPFVTCLGRYEKKKIPFHGYKELGSLHPARFKPDISKVKEFNPSGEKYFLLRLVSLKATHDVGKKGLNDDDVDKIIRKLKNNGRVYITSERQLSPQLEKYRISLNPNHIAQAIYYAEILISDSQTMSTEAGMLGTPFIRCNDFVGKINSLNELENNYNLGFGIIPTDKGKLFKTIDYLLSYDDLKSTWEHRRKKMISEKIDLTGFLVWLFQEYPESVDVLKDNIEYQKRFIGK